MASLKDVRMKIAGVGKTKQITKAMNMVASAKLRGAQSRMESFEAYASSVKAMLGDLAAAGAEISHPLLSPRETIRRVGIVLSTSDRGLCGGFNSNLIAEALRLAAGYKQHGTEVVFYTIGRKGRDAVHKRGYETAQDFSGLGGIFNFQLADRLGQDLIGDFLAAKVDQVILVYGRYASRVQQVPTQLQVLPLEGNFGAEAEKSAPGVEHIYEPKGPALLEALLPRVFKSLIYSGLLHTATSEQAARMTAMDAATRNCDDLIKSLTQLFNKTRQAAITSDLIDIVSGADALNG